MQPRIRGETVLSLMVPDLNRLVPYSIKAVIKNNEILNSRGHIFRYLHNSHHIFRINVYYHLTLMMNEFISFCIKRYAQIT